MLLLSPTWSVARLSLRTWTKDRLPSLTERTRRIHHRPQVSPYAQIDGAVTGLSRPQLSYNLLTPLRTSLDRFPQRRSCFTHSRMSAGAPTTTKDPSEYRLPTNVKPTHYDVTVRTDLDKLKFDGFVTVQYVPSDLHRVRLGLNWVYPAWT